MMPPFIVFPTNRIAHFVEVSLYLFYLAQQVKLRIEDKCIVLNEILHMFQSQSGCANLTLIGGPAKAGRIAMNSNITECKSISIINQSSSGIFEKKIDLLKL